MEYQNPGPSGTFSENNEISIKSKITYIHLWW